MPPKWFTLPRLGPEAAEQAFGIALLAFAGLVLMAMRNSLETVLYAAGPAISLNGAGIMALAIRAKTGPARIGLGLGVAIIGFLVTVHNVVLPPDVAAVMHLLLGLAILVAAVLLLSGVRRPRARWLGRTGAAVEA